MYNSKLIRIFSSFNEDELNGFETFLLSQIKEDNNTYKLYAVLKKAHPNYEDASLEKNRVYNSIFKNKQYKDVKVRELMSALTKLAEQYLSIIESTKNEFYTSLALLNQYRKRQLTALYKQQVKQVSKLIEQDKFLNAEFFKRKLLFADIENDFFEQQQVRTHDESLGVKNENLDKYYFSTKLQTLCELLNRENILNDKFNKTLENEIVEIAEKHKKSFLDVPSIQCYYEIYLLLKSKNDEQQYQKAFNTINKYQKAFEDSELKSMYAYLINYCIQHINKGINEFTPKLFELQKTLLQNKILLENGWLSHISYRNIVSIAIKLNEYSWAEKFIDDYKEKIQEKYRENAYNLSASNLLYAKHNYEETIGLLNQVEFTDVYYACTAKFTLLKAYYALAEWETLDYFVSAFQLYLKRNKEISTTFKKSSENFIKYFKKLLLIIKQIDYKENSYLNKKVKDLNQAIQEEKILANKAWLLTEINKIKL